MTITPVYLGEKPNGVSPSRVSQFIQCPRQYQYVSVEKLPEKKSEAAYKGTIFHAILEALYALAAIPEDRTIENCMALFREIYPVMMSPEIMVDLEFGEAEKQKTAAEIARMIRIYFHMENPPAINLVSTELRLDYDMGGFGLRGIIDRLDRNSDGQLCVRDYKTGKTPKRQYEAKALQACQVYAFLVEKIYGERPAEMTLIYVKDGTTINRPVWDRDIEEAEARVRGTWKRIEDCYERGYFPPQPSVLCNWCAFEPTCLADRNSLV